MQFDEETLSRLAAIGWRVDAPLPDGTDPAWRAARVVVQHRNGYVLNDGSDEFPAQPAPRFLRRRAAPEDRPAVGDFVLVDAATPAVIHAVLPRRTTLARAAAGERYARQIIATNIDTAFVLMGLDGDFNPRRIERYLLLLAGSGVRPVIVLTKADFLADAAMHAEIAALRAQIPQEVELHAMNVKRAPMVAPLLRHLQRGDTAVLLGSSGAGKSTLTNTLLGHARQATGAVREHDSRGRHTTTYRALITLPSGGCLIDTPGMRELKLTGEEDLAEASFDDVEALALECRFGDCAHGAEPGCAVRAALESGALDPARWDSYRKLRGELGVANESLAAQLERKAGAKVQTRALGKRLVDKYGRR
ncbi:MAG: ribosome small subunit-dependent GTPase A [Rudaea sp.]|uniref:ribosome small subunit-dependent GTPase A n=1 Tax=Rudaea sp. TaxID=2136325 RepID=UPI0039E55112